MYKRLLDLVVASILAAVLAPLALFIVCCILIESRGRGPVFFRSERIGKDGKKFVMPKFRSMHTDSPIVPTLQLKDSNRFYTGVGKFLRKTSLDEMPQLWSVIKGDMSLVGPRPMLSTELPVHHLRKKYGVSRLKPGMTGWAQINGRDQISIMNKINLDCEYLMLQGLRTDIKILLMTLRSLVDKHMEI